jgi:hypothetical protein
MRDASCVVPFTAILILCSTLLQFRYARLTELTSEALCWTLLPILIRFARDVGIFAKSGTEKHASTRSKSPWIIAGGIAVTSLCKTKADILWILVSNHKMRSVQNSWIFAYSQAHSQLLRLS